MPWPLLGYAFRNTAKRQQTIRTYLFISTTIMKQDDFRDLRNSSTEALKQAQVSARRIQHTQGASSPWPMSGLRVMPTGGIHPKP